MNYKSVEANLDRVRRKLDGILATVPDDQWTRKPARGGWSVCEVLAHLIQVESAIHGAAEKMLAQPPKPLKRKLLRVPIVLIQWRGAKRQSPIPLDSTLVTSKAEMLAKFAERRAQTLAFLRNAITEGRDFTGYHWRHPFFGSLTFQEWCRVIAYHETRHTKQIQEIVSSFQS